jgi:hypothetical protein
MLDLKFKKIKVVMQWFLGHFGRLANNGCLLFFENASNASKLTFF